MGKITKAQTKLHDEAMVLVNSDKELTDDDIEFVYEHYSPMAEHNVGKGAIFFTPLELAGEFAIVANPTGTVADLCAGIGILSYKILRYDHSSWHDRTMGHDVPRLVCVENNPEFVRVGKRLLPQVEWIQGSVFDMKLLQSIGEVDHAISNPPYGNVASKEDGSWLKTRGPAQWMVMEVAQRITYTGGTFILPEGDADYDLKLGEYRARPLKAKYLDKNFPGLHLNPWSMDYDIYKKQWKGAAPNIAIVNIANDDVDWDRPFGFKDVTVQEEMI